MKQKINQLIYLILEWKRMIHISSSQNYSKEREKADIIRLVHSIEKGLCIENPRLGFGVEKINILYDKCIKFSKLYGPDEFCLYMAYDAIKEYIRVHEDKHFENIEFSKIKIEFIGLNKYINQHEGKVGGIQQINSKHIIESITSISEAISCRHSVREFKKDVILDKEIIEAIRIAQLCPSACNRQAVRAYVLPSEKICELYNSNLSGIGGFAENSDKFIVVTGKISAYDFGEYNQYIVSASIFSSYLALALLDRNIGSCIVQRPLRNNKQFKKIAKYCNIPNDEQMVLLMAIGRLKDEYLVPISGRFPTDDIVKFCDK